MSSQYHIKDWEGYDPSRHTYIVITGEGEPWVAGYPIFEAIEANINTLAGSHYGIEYYEEKYWSWTDYLISLRVECQGWTVAEFDRITWEWRTLSCGTMPPLQKGE